MSMFNRFINTFIFSCHRCSFRGAESGADNSENNLHIWLDVCLYLLVAQMCIWEVFISKSLLYAYGNPQQRWNQHMFKWSPQIFMSGVKSLKVRQLIKAETRDLWVSCGSAEWEVIVPNSEYVSENLENEFWKTRRLSTWPRNCWVTLIDQQSAALSQITVVHLNVMCISFSQQRHEIYQNTGGFEDFFQCIALASRWKIHIMNPTCDCYLQHDNISLFLALIRL